MPKILLVEDNEMNRDMFARRLLKRGFEVVLAVDGLRPWKWPAPSAPDLILMDISLPGSTAGRPAVGSRPRPETQAIPDHRPHRPRHGRRPGKMPEGPAVTNYDTKPVEFPRLLEKIQRSLGEITKFGRPFPLQKSSLT